MDEKNNKNCVFCKIVRNELPSAKLFETEKVLAFLDIAPINKGHALVIPKRHFVDIHDLPEEEFKEIATVIKRIASAVKKATNAEGINVLQANGKAAGQEVFHFHVHIIPRFNDDNSGFKWLKKAYSEGEMQEFQKKIKKFL